jgi:methionyl-tRNA synthetase
LMGVKQGFVLPWKVPANEFYNLQGGKFSTSQNWTIPLDAFADNYDVEAARFYLLSSAPETADSEWSWPEFQSCVNAKLADKIGNLITRVLRFIDKNFESTIPPLAPEHETDLDRILLEECGQFGDPGVSIEEFHFRKAAEQLIAIAVVANVFVDRMAPWKLLKTDPTRAASVLNTCCDWLALLARWMHPFMPEKSRALWLMLGFTSEVDPWPMEFRNSESSTPKAGPWRRGRPGHGLAGQKLGTVQGLFAKIDDERIAAEIAALESRRPNVG